MAIPNEKVTVQAEGLTVSNIIWRRFKSRRPGLIERVFDLNPGLAGLGPLLPVGTQFLLPIDPTDTRAEKKTIISLWD